MTASFFRSGLGLFTLGLFVACSSEGTESGPTTLVAGDGGSGSVPIVEEGSGGSSSSTCPLDQMECSTGCVDVQRSVTDCGGCGITCAAGESCSGGACLSSCLEGETECNAICVDVAVDPMNCGACDAACRDDQTCGAAGCACSQGRDDCSGACVDTSSDAANCGGCGSACGAGQLCSNGKCGSSCESGETQCGQSCVDIDTSEDHCGGCDAACPAAQSCVDGACECPSGLALCGGACVDLNESAAHCGQCNNACGAGSSCDTGDCTQVGVVTLTLIDADTDLPIGELKEGDVLDLDLLSSVNLNVRADVAGLVGSVVFALDGNNNYRTESSAPYALAGDASGDYAPWTPSLGDHILSVTAYSASGGSGGEVGSTLSVSFSVIDTGDNGGSGGASGSGGAGSGGSGSGGAASGGSPGAGGSNGGCQGAQFEEQDGVIVVDMESISPATGWSELTNHAGYLGSAYFEWLGPASNNSPGNGLLEYKVKINNPGKYGFMWRAMVGKGSNTSEHNDSFLRFPEVAECKVYGEKNGTKKYANGCGSCGDIVSGTSKDCWYKIYGHALDWAWKADTSDNDARNIFVEFDSPGVYTIQVSGRSQYHRVDRMVLYNVSTSSLNAAKDSGETLCN